MDERGQFTFYKSYWEAIMELPEKDQLPILKAIIKYALFGEVPVSLTAVRRAVFLLVKPTLDTGRKKAANGKQGGSKPKANGKQNGSKRRSPDKQNGSKRRSPDKQNAREKEVEKEVEKEKENEIEGEIDKRSNAEASAPVNGKAFTAFWDAYPSKIGRETAWEAWKERNPDSATVQRIMDGLECWKKSEQWTEDGGRFIPRAAKFLTEGHWQSPPLPAQNAGKNGFVWASDWSHLSESDLDNIRRIMEEDVP